MLLLGAQLLVLRALLLVPKEGVGATVGVGNASSTSIIGFNVDGIALTGLTLASILSPILLNLSFTN